MNDTKTIIESKTVLWAIAGLLATFAGKYGFLVDQVTIASILTDALSIVTTVGVVHGRIKADKVIDKVI